MDNQNLNPNETFQVIIADHLTEYSEYPPIPVRSESIDIDFVNLRSVNSTGIRGLINYLKKLDDFTIKYLNCPVCLLDTINMVPELLTFRGPEVIQSFYLPFDCEFCFTDQEKLIEVANPEKVFEQLHDLKLICRSCNRPTALPEGLEHILYLFTDIYRSRFYDKQRNQRSGENLEQIVHDFKASLTYLEELSKESATMIDAKKPVMAYTIKRIREMISYIQEGASSTKFQMQYGELNLEPLVHELSPVAHHKNINLIFTPNLSMMLFADILAIERSLTNLLINAIESATSTVEISVTESDGHLRAVVSDDGPGIPDAMKAEIFSRGFSSKNRLGSGLGLYYVSQTAKFHGGIIKYLREGNSTHFIFEIPFKQAREHSQELANVESRDTSSANTYYVKLSSDYQRIFRSTVDDNTASAVELVYVDRLDEISQELARGIITDDENFMEYAVSNNLPLHVANSKNAVERIIAKLM